MLETLNVEWIRTTEALAAIAIEWDELLADSSADTLALTHLWQMTWWKIFGADRDLCVLGVRNSAGKLVGVAPLLRRKVWHRGLVPLYRLEFLASGEDQSDEIDSDYLDFVLRSGWEIAVLERIFDYLCREAPFAWDELELRYVPEESGTRAESAKLAEQKGLAYSEFARASGIAVSLPKRWEDLLAKFSGHSRRAILYERRHLERSFRVGFHVTSTRADFEAAWPVLVELHQRRWRASDKPGCFSSPRFTDFHLQVGTALAASDAARIATLTADGKPVAIRYLYVHGGRAYDYQSGQDPAFDSRMGIGVVLVGFCVEAAITSGLVWYDFLKGMNEYKERWSKERRHQLNIRLGRSGWREQARSLIEGGVDRLKTWRGRSNFAESKAESPT